MKKKSPSELDKIASYEKALKKKFGEKVLSNPRENLTPEKYKEYRKQAQAFYRKIIEHRDTRKKVERNGYRVSERLIKKETPPRICSVCKKYSFNIKDDVYLIRFECCFDCYLDYVEGREETWDSRKQEIIEEKELE